MVPRAPATAGVGPAAAGPEVDAHGFGFTRQAAQADGQQPHPARREHVDGRQLLGQQDRVIVGQQQDARAEQDPLGRRRHEAEQLQRGGDGQGGRKFERPDSGPRIQRDVLGDVKRLEAAALRVPGHAITVRGSTP